MASTFARDHSVAAFQFGLTQAQVGAPQQLRQIHAVVGPAGNAGAEGQPDGVGIDLGNPHVVVALGSDAELDRLDLTVRPQLNPEPRHGANIEFVVPADPLVRHGVGAIRMRVFERGVGETLSCGTGVAASALAVRHWAGSAAPDHWSVEVPGGTLGVRVIDEQDGAHVLLSGPATLVYSGEIALA